MMNEALGLELYVTIESCNSPIEAHCRLVGGLSETA